MNFREWLLSEMPLSHYAHDFVSNDDDVSADADYVNVKKAGAVEGLDDKKDQVYKYPDGTLRRAGLTKFTRRDKSLISNPKTAKILEEKLKKIGFNFNILFIEDRLIPSEYLAKIKSSNGLKRLSQSEEFKDHINKYLAEKGIDKKNSITFVQSHTSGHMLTPWMILHRIGHSIIRYDHLPLFEKVFTDYFDKPVKGSSLSFDPVQSEKHRKASSLFWNNVGNIFMFKSAKNTGDLLNRPFEHNVFELVHELVAEYLWNGKIRINPDITSNSSWWGGDAKFRRYVKGVRLIENHIIRSLKSRVGQIVEPI